MKKMILFMTAMLLGVTASNAALDHKQSDLKDRVTNRYKYAQPITFFEGGVTFNVFPNGELDFRTPRHRTKSRRSYSNTSYGTYNAPGHTRHQNRYDKFPVRYDYYGRVSKVGRNHISYDRYNRVRRIGSVTMRYSRNRLTQVGGLYIHYNRWGGIHHLEGNVHYKGCGHCGINGCSTTHDPYYNFDQNFRYKKEKHHRKHRYNNKRKHDDDDDDHEDGIYDDD